VARVNTAQYLWGARSMCRSLLFLAALCTLLCASHAFTPPRALSARRAVAFAHRGRVLKMSMPQEPPEKEEAFEGLVGSLGVGSVAVCAYSLYELRTSG
jgi:hypothetical protein